MSQNANVTVLQQYVGVNAPAHTKNEHINSESKVDQLALHIQSLKAQQKALAEEIASNEAELLMICGVPDDGSQKFNTDHFVITTTGKLTRKITDPETLSQLAPAVIRVKQELDTRKLKSLASSNPMLYQKALACIETKAAKPGLKIEPVEA